MQVIVIIMTNFASVSDEWLSVCWTKFADPSCVSVQVFMPHSRTNAKPAHVIMLTEAKRDVYEPTERAFSTTAANTRVTTINTTK